MLDAALPRENWFTPSKRHGDLGSNVRANDQPVQSIWGKDPVGVPMRLSHTFRCVPERMTGMEYAKKLQPRGSVAFAGGIRRRAFNKSSAAR